jgi:hypothetical protein
MGRLLGPPGPNAAHLGIDMQNLFAPGRAMGSALDGTG